MVLQVRNENNFLLFLVTSMYGYIKGTARHENGRNGELHHFPNFVFNCAHYERSAYGWFSSRRVMYHDGCVS